MKKANLPLIIIGILSFGIFFSRMIPHQPNLTPVLALCLFSGFFAKGRWYSMVLPLLALAASDWYIGFYPGWGFNYVSLALLLFAGDFMKQAATSFVGYGFFGAVVFFLLSNFGVWMFSEMYPPTFEGLLSCYQMGIIFFRSTLVGTTAFMALFYVAYTVLKPYAVEGSTQRA